MKYRIIEKANGYFIPQVKFGFGWDWNNLDKDLYNWYIETNYCKFETFSEALAIIEKYKIQIEEDKIIKYYKIN
jgi:hypothetical protein